MFMLGLLLAVTTQQVDTLTLDQALAPAFDDRPQAAVAAGVVSRARGTSRVLGIVPNPLLQFDAYDAAPDHKVHLSQSMNWLFRRGADRGAGQAVVARARADSSAMMARIAAEVRRGFFGALAQGRLLGLATEQRILADSLRTIAERRLALGDISALERDQVALEADRARQAESLALEAAGVATAMLARSVGYAGADGLVPRGAFEEGLGADRF